MFPFHVSLPIPHTCFWGHSPTWSWLRLCIWRIQAQATLKTCVWYYFHVGSPIMADLIFRPMCQYHNTNTRFFQTHPPPAFLHHCSYLSPQPLSAFNIANVCLPPWLPMPCSIINPLSIITPAVSPCHNSCFPLSLSIPHDPWIYPPSFRLPPSSLLPPPSPLPFFHHHSTFTEFETPFPPTA